MLAGNIGARANGVRLGVRGTGEFIRIDVFLWAILYGITIEMESIDDDDDVVVVAEDAADSMLVVGCVVVIDNGESAGSEDVLCTGELCAFRKVLRTVGDVVDKVSNLRLVEVFPKTDGILFVFNDSFGRLAGHC